MPGLSEGAGPRPAGTRGAGGVSTEAGPAPSGGGSAGLSVTSTVGKGRGDSGHRGDGLSTVKPGHSNSASGGSSTHKGQGVSTSGGKGKGK